MNLRNFIREIIQESFLICEVKVDITDNKKRGFANQLGQMYKQALKSLRPIKIYGKLGITDPDSSADASAFIITLANGDTIKAVRNSNPAFGTIEINNNEESYFINSKELFSSKFPDLIKKYYLEYSTAKANILSI